MMRVKDKVRTVLTEFLRLGRGFMGGPGLDRVSIDRIFVSGDMK